MLDLFASIILNASSHGCQPKIDLDGCAVKGAPVVRLSLEGVNPVPWCKKGQPKTDKCRNGSESGGVKAAKKEDAAEPESRGSNRGNDKRPQVLSKKDEEPKCKYDDGSEAPCFGKPGDSKGGSTRLVVS
jgi:hypothetical protein